MVAAIRLRLRSELRASWRSWLALALFAGVLGGVALTAAAGARRADTAYPRLLRWAHASNATVIPHGSGLDGYYDDLARQPSVESLAVTVLYNMALPTDSATPDTNVSVSASPDGRYGIDVDRVKIVEGRSLDAADPNAALVDRGLAAREHLRPGSTLHLLFVPNDADGTPDVARATPLDFTVSGIALFDDQVVPANRQNAAPRARLSPAFVATGISGAVVTQVQVADDAAVRLRAGATVDDLRREASSVAARYSDTGGQVDVVDLGEQTAATKHALGPDAVALAAFAAMVGLVAIAVIAQLISRQLSIDGADLATMRALGMSARRLLVLAMAKVAAITVLGAAVAVGVAIAASPLMPVGASRIAEPRPGVDVNIDLLGVGFVLAALLPALVVLPAAWRLARGAPGLMGDYITAQPRLWRVTAALGSAGSPTAEVGVGMAFERGTGRSAVPTRSALAGTTAALVALVATVVFGSSLLRLVDTPRLYGQNWNLQTNLGFGAAPREFAVMALSSQSGLEAYAGGNYGPLDVAGTSVPAIGLDAIEGTGFLTLISGRQAATPEEIVLGTRTLRAAHRHVGDTLTVTANGAARDMRIVGEATFASFGRGAYAFTDLGNGAAVVASVLSVPSADTGCAVQSTCYNFFLLRYRHDVDLRAAQASVEQSLIDAGCPAGACLVVADQRPGDINDYARVRATPLALGAVLVASAIAGLLHVLVASVRRRRRDLAVLKTIGFTSRQVSAVVAWQASTLMIVALLIGLPLGVLAGRWTWTAFAHSIGVPAYPVVPALVLAATFFGALIVANVIAAGPGWIAARTRPAVVLRRP